MRKTQKILIGLFLGGVLLGGIGTGVGLLEYSSFAYGGEKLLGEEHLVTENLDFSFDLDGQTLILGGGYHVDDEVLRNLVADNTVPAGTVRYEVTYNQEELMPVLSFEEYEEPEDTTPEELEDPEENPEDLEENPEDLEENPEGLEPENPVSEQTPESKPVYKGTLYLTARYQGGSSDFRLLMENKDQFLEDLKQKKISSYDVAYITDVKIKVNPATLPYLEVDRVY